MRLDQIGETVDEGVWTTIGSHREACIGITFSVNTMALVFPEMALMSV
jgi:hypothetical protein